MSSPAIQSALAQMQVMAAQAGGQAAKGPLVATQVGQGGFAGELHASIQRINRLQQASSAKAMAFQAGDPNVELNDVMVDMQRPASPSRWGCRCATAWSRPTAT